LGVVFLGVQRGELADARRWARRCRAVDVPAAAQLADLIEIAAGDVTRLPSLIDHLDATHQRAWAAACRWRLGGPNRAEAERYFAREGAVRPDRLIEVFVPSA
jgi:hypothetical protein